MLVIDALYETKRASITPDIQGFYAILYKKSPKQPENATQKVLKARKN